MVGGALVAISLSAAPAAAQACLGQPVGGLAARATAGEVAYVDGGRSQDSGVEIGLAYWANPGGFIAYSVGYSRRMTDGGDSHIARATMAGELPTGRALPPGAGMCVTAGAVGAWFDGTEGGQSGDDWAFPIGIGLGALLPVGPAARLHPYIHPAIVLGEVGSEASIAPLLEAGMGFSRASFVARASIGSTFEDTVSHATPIPDLRLTFAAGFRF